MEKIYFWQAYVNTSLKQSNSERDAESQLQLQCRSDHRRIKFTLQTISLTHEYECQQLNWNAQCSWSGTEITWKYVRDEARLQGIFMETPVIQEVKACPRLITETPVEFKKVSKGIFEIISKNKIIPICNMASDLPFIWSKILHITVCYSSGFVSLLFLDLYVNTDTVSW